MEQEEFTSKELEQLDLIYNTCYYAMSNLLGYRPEWDMSWIGEIAEVLAKQAVKHFGVSEQEIYPYREG